MEKLYSSKVFALDNFCTLDVWGARRRCSSLFFFLFLFLVASSNSRLNFTRVSEKTKRLRLQLKKCFFGEYEKKDAAREALIVVVLFLVFALCACAG